MTEKDVQSELNKYQQMGFNKDQLLEIENGLLDGLDVTAYAKKENTAEGMNAIRHSLSDSNNQQETIPEEEELPKTEDEEKEERKKEKRQNTNRVLAYIALVFLLLGIIANIFHVINIIK